MTSAVTNELLMRYFAGRATPLEKQLIEDWAKEAAHQEVFYACLATWERQHPQYTPDTEGAIERHQKRIAHSVADDTPENTTANTKHGWARWLMATAATVLLVSGWVFRDQIEYQTYTTGFGKTQAITLSDGSTVMLNANSSLRVPRFGFGTDTREVFLNGEAEFNIQHTPDHQQFVVRTPKSFDVLVLGTTFTVYARQRGAKVVLSKGRIQLRYHDKAKRLLTMKPGDWVTFDAQGHTQMRQTPQPQVHAAWKEHRFVFDATPFSELSYLFEENFGVKVQIANVELASWTVSGSFTAQTAEELLQTLTEASGLTYRKEGGLIVIEQTP